MVLGDNTNNNNHNSVEDVDGTWVEDVDGALTNLVNFDVADDVTHTVTLCAT